LNDTWLNDFRQKFVSAWTNRQIHFNQHTNNRVEGQHALFKKYLHGTNSTLDRLVKHVDKIVDQQYIAIKESFEKSLIKRMSNHNLTLLEDLRGKVSHKALDLLADEIKKIKIMKENNATCSCRLYTGCGLPCACRLDKCDKAGIDLTNF